MSIQLVCPNGHVLKVSDDWAGKKGLCPVCKARIRVPKPSEEQLSDEAILNILGTFDSKKARKKLTDVPDLATRAPKARRDNASSEGEAKTTGQDAVPPKRNCPECHREIAAKLHICPHCRTHIAGLKDV
ncbi:MAG: hypothetical protein ACYTG0_32105 [Planctomycetota bacterium]|jgi:hypothetical protein